MARERSKGTRRGNGEGTLRPRRRRDKQTGEWKRAGWEARIMLADGRRKSIYGASRQEVAGRLAAAIRDRDKGMLIARDERQTLQQYLTSWLETVRPTVESSTYERYELDVQRHLVPALGKTRLAFVSPQQVQNLLAEKLNSGLAPRSVRSMRAVLRRALNEALALGLVTRNAAALVRAPKAPHGEMHVYDAEQVRALLDAAAGTRLEALLTLAVTSGMREGELLGLSWPNVNLDGKFLHVQTQLRRLREKGLTIKDVKLVAVGGRLSSRISRWRRCAVIALARRRNGWCWARRGKTAIWSSPTALAILWTRSCNEATCALSSKPDCRPFDFMTSDTRRQRSCS